MNMEQALEQYEPYQQITGWNEWHLRRMMKKRGFYAIKAKELDANENYQIDMQVVQEYPCHQCGGKRVKYLGFRRNERYKAFSVCEAQDCGWYEEF